MVSTPPSQRMSKVTHIPSSQPSDPDSHIHDSAGSDDPREDGHNLLDSSM